MDLQSTFYLLGIIYMVLGILILIGIVILLFYIKKKIGDLHDFVELRVDQLTNLTLKPVKKASDIVRDILPTSSKKTARTAASARRR
jgi:uncharacterized membrane protein